MSENEIINAREDKYGSFEDGAKLMQAFKDTLRASEGFSRLYPYQREAVEMMTHKLSRIINGDGQYLDSWRDIVGYCQLVVDTMGKNGGYRDSKVEYFEVD